jgi:hypothetical protein
VGFYCGLNSLLPFIYPKLRNLLIKSRTRSIVVVRSSLRFPFRQPLDIGLSGFWLEVWIGSLGY